MNISRSNYEIWFTDWLDNKLGPSEMEQLRLFLIENPDLRPEFEELNYMRLDPPMLHMPFRELLKKNASDLPASQFDLLCVAYHENDLSDQQKNDLREMIAGDSKREEIFALSGKIKLSPPDIEFSAKKALMKQTLSGKIFRIAAPVLSAAATIVIALLLIRPEKAVISKMASSDPIIINYDSAQRVQPGSAPASITTQKTIESPSAPITGIQDIASPGIERVNAVTRAELNLKPELSVNSTDNSLIVLQDVSLPVERTDVAGMYDDRNRIQRLLAFKFREKILNEDLPDTSPINGFDIAEAGINGLNKLFGWEMQLEKSSQGEPGSISFSSRLVKFSTPVKNNESSE
jgi:hypothetical protein